MIARSLWTLLPVTVAQNTYRTRGVEGVRAWLASLLLFRFFFDYGLRLQTITSELRSTCGGRNLRLGIEQEWYLTCIRSVKAGESSSHCNHKHSHKPDFTLCIRLIDYRCDCSEKVVTVEFSCCISAVGQKHRSSLPHKEVVFYIHRSCARLSAKDDGRFLSRWQIRHIGVWSTSSINRQHLCKFRKSIHHSWHLPDIIRSGFYGNLYTIWHPSKLYKFCHVKAIHLRVGVPNSRLWKFIIY